MQQVKYYIIYLFFSLVFCSTLFYDNLYLVNFLFSSKYFTGIWWLNTFFLENVNISK